MNLLLPLLLLCAPAGQDAGKDVLVLHDGKLVVGTVVAVDEDGITFRSADGSSRKYTYAELDPYSAYEVRLGRIDVDNAAARVALGDFCVEQELHRFALREYRLAAELDPSLAKKMKKKIAQVSEDDASRLLARGEQKIAAGENKEAAKALGTVLKNYPTLKQAQKARQLLDALTAKLEEANKKKEEQKKKAEKALKAAPDQLKELKERTALARAVKFIEDAKKYWSRGMDREGEGRTKQAARAWKDAVERLNLAHRELTDLVESNDIEMIKKVRVLRPEANVWLIRSFNSLAQMYTNSNQLQEATLWINQTLKLDPANTLARTLKLEITRALLRRKNP